MRISLLTYGSRGDVQPFIALAIGLANAGHQVRLAAPHGFDHLVNMYKISFVPLAGDPEELSALLNSARNNVFEMVKKMNDYVRSIAIPVAQNAFAACDDADLVVHSFLFTTGAHSLANARGIPDVSLQGFPIFVPTRAFPMVATPRLPAGGLSYISHWLGTQAFWHIGNSGFRKLRKQAPDLFNFELTWPWERSARVRSPLIFAYSPTVLPRPKDWTASYIHIPGFFFLDMSKDYRPPPELVDFLAAGDRPFCVTFGSMINQEASRIHEMVLQALEFNGQRAVFLSGWSGISISGEHKNYFGINSAPHDWLFSHCKAVIYHGGAGTTGATLRAGIPGIVIPHGMDQLFWARQVARLGVGYAPIEINRLSVETLTSAIQAVIDPVMYDRAQKIGELVRQEDGIGQAVRIIEQYAADFNNSR